MKYALINDNGFPTAFYSTELHGDNIPAEAFEISEEDWIECLENQGLRRWVDGALVVYTPEEPPVVILEKQPERIACALRVVVDNGEVTGVGGSYRIAAMFLVDDGTFLAIFTQPLGDAEPFIIPNNGVSATISEWAVDYATIEVRDHAGGTLITPEFFGFSLYNV